jgi:flagellar hook assembly protein FlgD
MAITDNTRLSVVLAQLNDTNSKVTLTVNFDIPTDGVAYKILKKDGNNLRMLEAGDDSADLYYLLHRFVGPAKGQQAEFAVPVDFSSDLGGALRLKKGQSISDIEVIAKAGTSVSIDTDGCLKADNSGVIKNLKIHVMDIGAGKHLNTHEINDTTVTTGFGENNMKLTETSRRKLVRVGT